MPLGCLIRGETAHFDVLVDAVAAGLMTVSLEGEVAIPFGVLTCETLAQAKARAGGRDGNKGAEAMEAALSLVALTQRIAPSRRRSAPSAATASSRATRAKRSSSPGTA